MLSAIPAIVLGIVSLVKINKSQGQLKGNGLAIAGLAVPFAVLPIIGILMGILMPALAEAREQARKTVCAKNMSALSKAMLIYASDYGEQYPTSSEWCDLLIEHNKESKKVFGCPGAYEGTCNYAMNKNAEVLGIVSPPDMVLLFETKPGWNQFGGSEILSTENHRGVGCNIVFVDGHVEFVKKEGLNGLKWTSE
jgi:prepilin-type processing-associated H-X9-DG protein